MATILRLFIAAALVAVGACSDPVQLSGICEKPREGKPILACTGHQPKADVPLPAQG